MGQTFSRPRLAAAVVVGSACLLATVCLLSGSSETAEAEEVSPLPSKPTSDEKKEAKDSNEQLRNAAEQTVASSPRPPDYESLEVKGLLGCGGFGAVELVENKTNGNTFALKSISKGFTVKANMQMSLQSERLILLLLDSPFIVKCHGTYNRPEHICFLLEVCLGGELYSTYIRRQFHGSEEHARYYVASVILALAYMHSKHVVHRNVKPEDCILDSGGKLKLCDMGLAKVIAGKTFTTCGTPDYFAPEVIASKGHGFEVDWWTVGVLLFELLAGRPPFESAYPMQIYSKVMKGIGKVDFPAATKKAEPLIKAIMKTNPQDRLPVLSGGIDNVKRHAWFSGFDWEGLENQRSQPPYVPEVKSPADLDNFSAKEEDRPTCIPYVDDGSGWADNF